MAEKIVPGKSIEDYYSHSAIVTSPRFRLVVALRGEIIVECTGGKFHQPVGFNRWSQKQECKNALVA